MADPLSVAAGIVGLVTAAAQVSQTLTNIINRTKKTPKECQDARAEVDDMRIILQQLQLFVLGMTRAPRARTSLILVDHVVTTLAAAVTTFSELDVFVDILDSDQRIGLVDRLRWVSKAKSLADITRRLQLHKSFMNLMLTILTCKNTVEAEDKVDELCSLVDQTIKQNAILAQRLASYESGNAMAQTEVAPRLSGDLSVSEEEQKYETKAVLTLAEDIDKESHLDPYTTSWPTEDDNGGKSVPRDQPRPSGQEQARMFVFEELLMNSRVYRKMAWDNSDTFSVLSSAGRSGTWSMLSGLSLSEMSNIAVLALPVYATDLENKGRYDFGGITEETTIITLSESQNNLLGPSTVGEVSPRSNQFQFFSRRKRSSAGTTAPDEKDWTAPDTQTVMGVQLHEVIKYANAAISINSDAGEVFMFGSIPFLVAKCGKRLKDQGEDVKDLFVTSGHPARVLALEKRFSTPPGYGRRSDWTGFTIYDSASLLLRYIKALPEPIIPFTLYQEFTTPFRQHADWKIPDDHWPCAEQFSKTPQQDALMQHCQRAVSGLPSLQRQLLTYILDLMAFMGRRWNTNNMPVSRIVGFFHPAILAGRPGQMDEIEHRLAQDIVIFLTHWEDYYMDRGLLVTNSSSGEMGG